MYVLLMCHVSVLHRIIGCELCIQIIPYQRFFESTKFNAAFILRQHFHSSLHTRISMRPFLSNIEKRWIVYSILQAIAQAHNAGVVHLDIKSENIMVTSWNWVFLTDFASFKPMFVHYVYIVLFSPINGIRN